MSSEDPANKTPISPRSHRSFDSLKTSKQSLSSTNSASKSNLFNYTKGDLLAGKYKLGDVIGQGGMGKIYKATQVNRTVAIKIILAPDDDNLATQRFESEASITANLTHPNTIRVFDFGTTEDGSVFLVMEYLDGLSLKQYLRKNGALPPVAAAKIVSQICGALTEAHQKGLVHRDIKPGNIMLINSPTEGIQAKLLDFGLAKNLQNKSITQTGALLGSPMYMSPEQIENQKATPLSDIYSLGLTFYSMLSNKSPFYDGSIFGILKDQLATTPKSLFDIDENLISTPSLVWIINTAIEKDPRNRFISPIQMKHALDCFLKEPKSKLELINGALYKDGQPVKGANVAVANVPLQDEAVSPVTQASLGNNPTLNDTQPALLKKNFLSSILTILTIIVLLGLGYSFFQQPEPPQKTQIQPIPQKTEVTTETKTEAPLVAQQEIHLDTVPSGATVFDENGEQISITPLMIRIDKAKSVTLRLDGYEEQSITLNKDIPDRIITLKAKATIKPVNNPLLKKEKPKAPKDIRSISRPKEK